MSRYSTEVVENDNVFDATCHDNRLDETCFTSTGWETREKAESRIREHLYEHAEGVPARELGAFILGISQEDYEVRVADLLDKNSVALPEEKEETE